MAEPITEEQIIETLLPYLKRANEDKMGIDLEDEIPLFSLEDLVGKTISNATGIKNPLPYDPAVAGPNPEEFKVLTFSDGSYLLHMDIGWHDGSTLHSFLVKDNNVRYSPRLYQ